MGVVENMSVTLEHFVEIAVVGQDLVEAPGQIREG
jgi:hypothetical protein